MSRCRVYAPIPASDLVVASEAAVGIAGMAMFDFGEF
jgi:hypothetical protein